MRRREEEEGGSSHLSYLIRTDSPSLSASIQCEFLLVHGIVSSLPTGVSPSLGRMMSCVE